MTTQSGVDVVERLLAEADVRDQSPDQFDESITAMIREGAAEIIALRSQLAESKAGHEVAIKAADHCRDMISDLQSSLGIERSRAAEAEGRVHEAEDDFYRKGLADMREAAALEALRGGFILARDGEWDAGANFARGYISERIRSLTPSAGSEKEAIRALSASTEPPK